MVYYEFPNSLLRLLSHNRNPPPIPPPRNCELTTDDGYNYPFLDEERIQLPETNPSESESESNPSESETHPTLRSWVIIISVTLTVFVVLVFFVFSRVRSFLPRTSAFRKDSNECPNNYTFFEDTCFCYKVELTKMKFDEAREACQSEHATLTSVHSINEHRFLNTFYQLNLAANGKEWDSRFWLGLMDDQVWKQETSAERRNSFICKMPSRTTERKMAEMSKTENATAADIDMEEFKWQCTFGYIPFGETGYCYKETIQELTFDEASESCESDGAQLTSVHSITEHFYLIGHHHVKLATKKHKIKTKFWLGLIKTDKDWHWTDGSKMDFVNWEETGREGEADKNWVVVDGNNWRLANSFEKHSFICKKLARKIMVPKQAATLWG